MMDGLLTALGRIDWLVGGAVAVVFVASMVGGLVLLNQWQDWWMSTRRHRDLMTVMQARVDEARGDVDRARADAEADIARAHADADSKVSTMREAMKEQARDLRKDGQDRAAEVRSGSQAELDRLIKFADSLQRDVESWRLAWNLADQANSEEDDARWNTIVASLTVIERVITAMQQQSVPGPLELEAGGRDGGGPSRVR